MAARVRALTARRLPRRERKTSFPSCHGKNNAGVSVSILKHGHLNCHSLPASISAKGKRVLRTLASLRLRGKDVCQGCSQVEGQQTRFQRCDPPKNEFARRGLYSYVVPTSGASVLRPTVAARRPSTTLGVQARPALARGTSASHDIHCWTTLLEPQRVPNLSTTRCPGLSR